MCKPELRSTHQCSWMPTHQCKGWWVFASWGTMQAIGTWPPPTRQTSALSPPVRRGIQGQIPAVYSRLLCQPLRKSEQMPTIYWDRRVCNECGNGIVHVVWEGKEGPLTLASFTALIYQKKNSNAHNLFILCGFKSKMEPWGQEMEVDNCCNIWAEQQVSKSIH